MPTPNEIRSALGEIANNWQGLAVFWHVYAIAALALILTGYGSIRIIAILLVLPLFR